jgi:hypothetical protein
MQADLIRTSLRDSSLGVAPGVHEAWHKNAEKACSLLPQGLRGGCFRRQGKTATLRPAT